ncbi:MAG: hypothetical protein CMQ22_09390 [Gammaproteobacteria bacterium]|nr:hypothetical protein [Gammaproteobacteria bacterium]
MRTPTLYDRKYLRWQEGLGPDGQRQEGSRAALPKGELLAALATPGNRKDQLSKRNCEPLNQKL